MSGLRLVSAGAMLLLAGCELLTGLHGERTVEEPPPGSGGAPGSRMTDDTGGVAAEKRDASAAGGSASAGAGGRDAADARPADAARDGSESESGAIAEASTSTSSGGTGAQGAGGAFDAGPEVVVTPGEPPPIGPSCAGALGTECRGESCCTSSFVPGGRFGMGRSIDGTDKFPGGSGIELPEHPVTVSPFWLDKYEVTVSRFRRYLASLLPGNYPQAEGGANPNVAGSGWQPEWNTSLLGKDELTAALLCSRDYASFTPGESNSDQLPINCISWYDAFAFCIWDGGRLPTEAEWEFAAAGGAENRLYPWGQDVPTKALTVTDCWAGGSAGTCAPNDVKPVGSIPAGDGRWGHADLAGSIMEYTLDTHVTDFYSKPEAVGRDVVSFIESKYRALRGGNFFSTAAEVRSVWRGGSTPDARWDGVGIRCARNPR